MKSLETHLRDTEWMGCLGPELAAYVQAQAIERHVPAGSFVYSRGMEPEFWIGVIEGLLLMCRNSQAGRTTAVASVHCGDWIGEASLLFLKQRQFDLVAVRASRLACIPRATFRHLYETSIPFNHYLVLKLGKRVGQFARPNADASRQNSALLHGVRRLARFARRRSGRNHSNGSRAIDGSIAPTCQQGIACACGIEGHMHRTRRRENSRYRASASTHIVAALD